ncbi:MAG: RNA polymerase sigma factor [Planctomycetes bacterium]|nr:RNA polymerase sigma factor [Planctomycetota bacterium]
MTTEFSAAAASLWTLAAGVLGHRTHAEDVLQEAAMIAWQKRSTFTPGTSFRAWMGRIVRFVAQNHRRRQRRRRTESVANDDLDTAPAPTRSMTPNEGTGWTDDPLDFSDPVFAALQQLKPIARACLLLKVVGDHDYREIAALLGIPEGTAMSHVSRARTTLAGLLTAEPRPRA